MLIRANRWDIFVNSFHDDATVHITAITNNPGMTPTQILYLQNMVSSQISSILQTWVQNGQNEVAEELVEMFELPYRVAVRQH
ncbi:MAG: hypothetical protein P8X74_12070 [Reinekea sp.]